MASDEISRDTIAAIATPAGRGGIGVVRISGPAVPVISKSVLGMLPEPRHASLARFRAAGAAPIDEGLALYWVLLAAIELRHAPFVLWIHDLSALDPYYVLPILMTGTMILQTKMNPVPPDPVQARVMQFMPYVFSIFFFFFPAGLVLYWLVNNILSIAQQWQIQRMFERGKPAHAKR